MTLTEGSCNETSRQPWQGILSHQSNIKSNSCVLTFVSFQLVLRVFYRLTLRLYMREVVPNWVLSIQVSYSCLSIFEICFNQKFLYIGMKVLLLLPDGTTAIQRSCTGLANPWGWKCLESKAPILTSKLKYRQITKQIHLAIILFLERSDSFKFFPDPFILSSVQRKME
jgi:hypothetical protein